MHSDLELEYKHFEELDSTNDFLRTLTPSTEITIVSTDFQTKGRGQMGNTWLSNRGENLLFSILLQPNNLKASDGFVLSQAMALSIKEALDNHIKKVSIKWPNDIYSDGKKICGTLIENTLFGKLVGRSIIGSGININQKSFPDGLAAPPTSIYLLTNMETSPSYLLNSIMENFTKYYQQIQEGEYTTIRQLYHQHLYLRGQCCWFQDSEGEFLGKISHVETDGHLIIEDNHLRQRRYAFKEVKFLHINQNINQ